MTECNSHLFHRILNDAVYNFPNNQEEITLVVCPETFKVKNYVDDEPGIINYRPSKIKITVF